jgi:hypothetical protein
MISHLFAQAGNIAPVEEHLSTIAMLQRGGFIMVVLAVCSIVALGVFIERMFYFKRSRMNVSEFLAGVLALVRGGPRAHRVGGAHGDLQAAPAAGRTA